MGIETKFILDKLKVKESLDELENIICVIQARWEMTNPDYPNGVSYHSFYKVFDYNTVEPADYLPIKEITDEKLEEWCLAEIDNDQINAIYMSAESQIIKTHKESELIDYYVNEDIIGTF
jgi:hypothetical protein